MIYTWIVWVYKFVKTSGVKSLVWKFKTFKNYVYEPTCKRTPYLTWILITGKNKACWVINYSTNHSYIFWRSQNLSNFWITIPIYAVTNNVTAGFRKDWTCGTFFAIVPGEILKIANTSSLLKFNILDLRDYLIAQYWKL